MKRIVQHLCSLTILLMSTQSLSAQWVSMNGPYNGSVNCIAFSGNNIYATANEGLFVSANNGDSWTAADSTLFEFIDVRSLAINGSHGIAGTDFDGVYLSADSGKTWAHNSNNGFSSSDIIALTFSGNVIFAGTGEGAYASVDYGNTWTSANTGMPEFSEVLSFAVKGTTVYAGTYDSVYIHTPGTGWTNISNGLPRSSFYSLVLSGTNIFAAGGSSVYLSSDSGKSWKAVNNGLQTFYAINSLGARGTNIFAGTGGNGIYASNNNGNSWTAVNNGLTDLNITSLAINGTTIYAGTQYEGVWERPLSEMLGIAESSNPLTGLQIYPNPAIKQLTIHTSIKDEHATISLRNVFGQETSPPTPLQRRGEDSVMDISKLEAGIYFIELKTGNGIVVKRFIKSDY